MRAMIGASLLALLAWPAVPDSAQGEELKFSDLQGLTITAQSRRQQTVKVDGRQMAMELDGAWQVKILPDNRVYFSFESTAHTPRGSSKATPLVGSTPLDAIAKTQARGGGDRVWRFSNDTLTFIRTYLSGAYRASFATGMPAH